MSGRTDVMPVDGLIGRSVLSLSSGNKLGEVRDVFLDPLNGQLIAFQISAEDGAVRLISFDTIQSFGHDAIMTSSDSDALSAEGSPLSAYPNVRELMGAKVITAGGDLLGQIAGVFVTASQDPFAIYEIRESLLDALLGRHKFVPASAGHAFSEDRTRLIIPDEAAEMATPTIEALIEGDIAVRSFDPAAVQDQFRREDDTVVVLHPDHDEDETVVADRDDETVVRLRRNG